MVRMRGETGIVDRADARMCLQPLCDRLGRRFLTVDPERERAVGLLAEKYPQYRSEPPDGPVLAVDVVETRVWSAAGGGTSPGRPA